MQNTVKILNIRQDSLGKDCISRQYWPRGYKPFSMLNSAKHGILDAYNYKNIKKNQLFAGSGKSITLFFLLIYVKMPTIVGILTFISRKNSMLSWVVLSWVEHEFFITSGPGLKDEFDQSLSHFLPF